MDKDIYFYSIAYERRNMRAWSIDKPDKMNSELIKSNLIKKDFYKKKDFLDYVKKYGKTHMVYDLIYMTCSINTNYNDNSELRLTILGPSLYSLCYRNYPNNPKLGNFGENTFAKKNFQSKCCDKLDTNKAINYFIEKVNHPDINPTQKPVTIFLNNCYYEASSSSTLSTLSTLSTSNK